MLTLPINQQQLGPGLYRVSYPGGARYVSLAPGARVELSLPGNALIEQRLEDLPQAGRLQDIDAAAQTADRLFVLERQARTTPGDAGLKTEILFNIAKRYENYGYQKRACLILKELASGPAAKSGLAEGGRLERALAKCR